MEFEGLFQVVLGGPLLLADDDSVAGVGLGLLAHLRAEVVVGANGEVRDDIVDAAELVRELAEGGLGFVLERGFAGLLGVEADFYGGPRLPDSHLDLLARLGRYRGVVDDLALEGDPLILGGFPLLARLAR